MMKHHSKSLVEAHACERYDEVDTEGVHQLDVVDDDEIARIRADIARDEMEDILALADLDFRYPRR